MVLKGGVGSFQNFQPIRNGLWDSKIGLPSAHLMTSLARDQAVRWNADEASPRDSLYLMGGKVIGCFIFPNKAAMLDLWKHSIRGNPKRSWMMGASWSGVHLRGNNNNNYDNGDLYSVFTTISTTSPICRCLHSHYSPPLPWHSHTSPFPPSSTTIKHNNTTTNKIKPTCFNVFLTPKKNQNKIKPQKFKSQPAFELIRFELIRLGLCYVKLCSSQVYTLRMWGAF